MTKFLRQTWVFILFIFFACPVNAQFYDNGQDPFSIKWRVIGTNNFDVIYPAGMDSLSNLYASYLESIHPYGGLSLGVKAKHIPVVLHSQNVLTNGEVGWAPKRMNFYSIPGQDNYFQPWHQHLSLHEFRHNAQLNKLNQSTTKVLSWIFGQQATGIVLGLHLPLWFIEGDAVAYETGASYAGRGRIPDFAMKMNAQLTQKRIYSYSKAMFGSYKDFTPNRYELGYLLVSGGRLQFGNKLWESAITETARLPFFLRPFSRGIEKATGNKEKEFYKQTINSLRNSNSFKKQQKVVQGAEIAVKENETYASYYHPQPFNNGVIALKTSFDKPSRFVFIEKNGRQKKIHTPGFVMNETYSYADSTLIWNEFKATRWANKNYSNVVEFDLRTKSRSYIVKKGKVFFSRLSADGSKIVSVEPDEKISWKISIRDATSGVIEDAVAFDTIQPIMPEWSGDASKIVFVAIGNHGKSLGVVHLPEKNIEWILKDEKRELSHPKFVGDDILLKATFDNTSNYLKYNSESQQWKAITNAPYGVGEAHLNHETLLFANYTADGFKINRLNHGGFINKTVKKPDSYETELSNALSRSERKIDFSNTTSSYKSKKYRRIAHLLNFHSWGPIAVKAENQEIGWGASVMSQNVLSTSFLTVGYQYHRAENSDEFYLNYDYKGFYPLLSARYSFVPFSFQREDGGGNMRDNTGKQQSLLSKVVFPFNLDRGAWHTGIQPELAYRLKLAKFDDSPYFDFTNAEQHRLAYRLYMYNQYRQSMRDLYSRWGQTFYIQFENWPFNSGNGHLGAAESWLYFPGVLWHHHIRLYGGYQEKETGDFFDFERLRVPRGYHTLENDEMISLQGNYSFPVAYPDWSLWDLLYIKRLKANLFYDVARYHHENDYYYQESAGLEFTADFHAYRFVAPVEAGMRYSRRVSDGTNFYEFLFSVNFGALY